MNVKPLIMDSFRLRESFNVPIRKQMTEKGIELEFCELAAEIIREAFPNLKTMIYPNNHR